MILRRLRTKVITPRIADKLILDRTKSESPLTLCRLVTLTSCRLMDLTLCNPAMPRVFETPRNFICACSLYLLYAECFYQLYIGKSLSSLRSCIKNLAYACISSKRLGSEGWTSDGNNNPDRQKQTTALELYAANLGSRPLWGIKAGCAHDSGNHIVEFMVSLFARSIARHVS